jgi:hypothetical protein
VGSKYCQIALQPADLTDSEFCIEPHSFDRYWHGFLRSTGDKQQLWHRCYSHIVTGKKILEFQQCTQWLVKAKKERSKNRFKFQMLNGGTKTVLEYCKIDGEVN